MPLDTILKRKLLYGVFIVSVVLFLDVTAASIYRALRGFNLFDRPLRVAQEQESKRLEPVDPFHHSIKKNLSGFEYRWGSARSTIYSNSLGFKDSSARAVNPDSDKYRVLFMGDSFAEGLGTRYEDTFAGLIDGKLSRDGIEVLNGAASGYSPVIYYAKIRYLIEELKLRLDEVTVFIDIGDADDEARLYRMDKNGNVAKVTSGTPLRREAGSVGIKAIIRQNTVLCYIVLNALHDIVVRDMMGPPLFTERTMWTIEDDPGRTISGKAVGRMQLYMGRLYRLLKDRGIKLRLAVYPQPAQIYFNDIGSVQERIWARWAMRHGVDFIDYFPYFIDIQSEKARAKAIKKYFIKGDIHWNAEGHALVADRWLEYFYEDVRYRAADRGEEKTPENMPPL